MTDRSQRRNGVIWLIVAVVGLILCILPTIFDIGIYEGAPAFIGLGGFLVLSGLIAAPMFFRRARVLAGMLQGGNFLAHWVTGEGTPDREEVTVSKGGLILNKDLYTFSGYSCRLEDVGLETRPDSTYLIFTLSHPAKYSRRNNKYDVQVPPGEVATAQRVIAALRASQPN
jgi:hypothetical protein